MKTRNSILTALAAIIFLCLSLESFGKYKKPLKKPKDSGYKFGFKAGLLASSMNTIKDKSSLPGLTAPQSLGGSAGLVFHFPLLFAMENMSVDLGAMIAYKNYKIRVKKEKIDFKYNSIVTPLEFPVIVSISSATGKQTYIREFVGLSLVYTGKFGIGDAASFYSNESTYTVNYEAVYPKEFGIQISAGFACTWELFKRKFVDIAVAYHYGLFNESVGNIEYKVNKEMFHSQIVNRGNYLAIELTYYFKQIGYCPKFK